MPDSFRFLINVDQCLNMSRFDMFFYKLESQHRFHASEVQLFGDEFGSSLRHAVLDIRRYLNRYSYYVSDFQIIVAMRSEYHEQNTLWRETMLYRLLQLHSELQDARIFVTSHEKTERAVNLVMLHDVDFSGERPSFDNYMSGERLVADCRQLFEEAGLDWDADYSREECREKLAEYAQQKGHDAAALKLLEEFFLGEKRRAMDEDDPLLREELETGSMVPGLDQRVLFSAYVKSVLMNYHVFEDLINRNNESEKNLTLLRLVEFINRSTSPETTVTGDPDPRSLPVRCSDNWAEIAADDQLERRYAEMLFDYRETLISARQDLERGSFSRIATTKLPEKHIPSDDEIRPEGTTFGSNQRKSTELSLKQIMESFEKTGIRGGIEAWDTTYRQLKDSLESMEKDLKEYARGLSLQYAGILEQRKNETRQWERENYDPGPDLESVRLEADGDRERRLKELKDSHIRSSLSFQDQLNMESALEQCNGSIRFKMHCARAVGFANFFALAILILLLFLGHYAVLQPYVFQDGEQLSFALLYILAVTVLIFSCWKLPGLYFRRGIRKEIQKLNESMDLYIRGYFDKADYFLRYINLLNQLDYISRYSSMITRVREHSEYIEKGIKWHLVQVRLHLDRLGFFRDLIVTQNDKASKGVYARISPTDYSGKIQNVVRCPVYWPQG